MKSFLWIVFLLSLFLTSCDLSNKNKTDWKLPAIPTVDEVGQANLPDEIAPVKAPFQTIDFKKPVFSGDTVWLDLSTKDINTNTIQQAINSLSEKGGGKVIVPEGEWLTGRIELKSNINLHIPKGSALRFSGWVKDFQPAVFTRIEGVEVMSLGACIYANN